MKIEITMKIDGKMAKTVLLSDDKSEIKKSFEYLLATLRFKG